MTQGSRRYWIAVLLLAAVAAGVILRQPPGNRPGLWLALGLTLVVQAPLGAWLVRAVRRGPATGVWALGMAARFGLVGLVGLVVLPSLRWPAAPALIALVTLLLALLLVEGAVLWAEHFGAEGR